MRWTTFRCINCGESYGGRTTERAVDKFFASPRHTCVAKWYPLVDPPSPYSKVGAKK